MDAELIRLFDAQNGVATSAQILAAISRHSFERAVDSGVLERIWHGIYCLGEPTEQMLLHGLDFACGKKVPLCLASAAALHGFDTEGSSDLHVLNPPERQLRSADGLVVHRRDGAPLTCVDGRYVTAPAWTAIEVARALRRPRALATLDAALRSGTCTRTDLWRAALEQAGRRGIVNVRNLIALADGRAESPMESEARLVMLDGGLPTPELQFEVIDGNGKLRRVDFAWPQDSVAVEYDSLDWHGNPDALRDDRRRTAALMDIGWTVISIVFEDVRHGQREMVARINAQLSHARAA
ncbi:type IV toxin-antitoxin system AbiEi family antitoxin domain-containing protein [Mycobacterium sp. TNTM28]|uniref:Type IV toxin-antitoxin system AbiEi family antitoxin domain-containing protein n=1 Tax=[Mycobacterium] fortunisiensis TaxID=2600579 RepID=A0ABS6KK57_9MYCO|nr:type IV toxin-antitoxin system AbiEi family antitoxin domain-containing protein [[Mycobacterium] fortunisiensis]MBU9763949.1 type IV toxin-antitoxin system AbiEi family antitoxin domain-containing protein [[Mycobacterium] fortunisiensis]